MYVIPPSRVPVNILPVDGALFVINPYESVI